MTAPAILAAIAAQPGLDPAFRRAIAPVEPVEPVEHDDEPPYDDDPLPLRDDRYADRAAANWWAGRTR